MEGIISDNSLLVAADVFVAYHLHDQKYARTLSTFARECPHLSEPMRKDLQRSAQHNCDDALPKFPLLNGLQLDMNSSLCDILLNYLTLQRKCQSLSAALTSLRKTLGDAETHCADVATSCQRGKFVIDDRSALSNSQQAAISRNPTPAWRSRIEDHLGENEDDVLSLNDDNCSTSGVLPDGSAKRKNSSPSKKNAGSSAVNQSLTAPPMASSSFQQLSSPEKELLGEFFSPVDQLLNSGFPALLAADINLASAQPLSTTPPPLPREDSTTSAAGSTDLLDGLDGCSSCEGFPLPLDPKMQRVMRYIEKDPKVWDELYRAIDMPLPPGIDGGQSSLAKSSSRPSALGSDNAPSTSAVGSAPRGIRVSNAPLPGVYFDNDPGNESEDDGAIIDSTPAAAEPASKKKKLPPKIIDTAKPAKIPKKRGRPRRPTTVQLSFDKQPVADYEFSSRGVPSHIHATYEANSVQPQQSIANTVVYTFTPSGLQSGLVECINSPGNEVVISEASCSAQQYLQSRNMTSSLASSGLRSLEQQSQLSDSSHSSYGRAPQTAASPQLQRNAVQLVSPRRAQPTTASDRILALASLLHPKS